MQWYIPMTIIPGVGLLILSTTNLMLALNNEIGQLHASKKNRLSIIKKKLKQLKKLSYAISFLYVGVFLFLASVICKLLSENEVYSKNVLIAGVISVGFALVILIIYSFNAVIIRQETLAIEHD